MKAQHYYVAAAELCRISSEHSAVPSRIENAFRGVADDRELFLMVSAACNSWIGWKDRESNGIAVAGQIVGVEELGHGKWVRVETADGKDSVVSVTVESTAELPAHGEPVVIIGTIEDGSVYGTVLGPHQTI